MAEEQPVRSSTRRKQKAFIKAYLENMCNVSTACKIVKINRHTYYNWLNNNSKFSQELDEAWETRNDLVQDRILQQIDEGNTGLMVFWAKTQMKHRGFVERTELNIDGKLEHGHDVLISAYDKRREEIEAKMADLGDTDTPKEVTGVEIDSNSRVAQEKSEVVQHCNGVSSTIFKYSYIQDDNKLKVYFKSDPDISYEYDCKPNQFRGLEAAKSKGKYIHRTFSKCKFKKFDESKEVENGR